MIGYFLKMKLKTVLCKFCIILIIVLLIYTVLTKYEKLETSNNNLPVLPVILWWTPFYENNLTKVIECSTKKCILTENKYFINNSTTIVYLFYGSKFNQYDLPLPRQKQDLWAIVHEESPKNLALFLHNDSHSLFNFTSTFSRFSDFPITLQYLPNIDALTDTKYMRTVEEKNRLLNDLSPILYIQSDCTTPLERDSYVAELMKYIPIDSYGLCLNNKKLPKKLVENPLNNLYSDDFLHFVAQYKFVIAFENAICDDYITEKLWRPLITGSVPIYMGSPSVMDWLPNNHSVIVANNFNSPKSLADYLIKLNLDDHLYNLYLEHKITKTIENDKLKSALQNRIWKIDDTGIHYFEAFECFICDNIQKTSLNVRNHNIYDCPDPISPLTRQKNRSNWWNSHWNEGRCQAHILNKFVNNPLIKNYTKEMFDNETNKLIMQNRC